MSAPDLKPFILAAALTRNPDEGTSPESRLSADLTPIFGDKEYAKKPVPSEQPIEALEPNTDQPLSIECSIIAAVNAELRYHPQVPSPCAPGISISAGGSFPVCDSSIRFNPVTLKCAIN